MRSITVAMPAVPEVVAVIGCGTIGLACAAALANCGVRVLGQDISATHVDALRTGASTPTEADLATAVAAARASGTIAFATRLTDPLLHNERGPRGFMIAVPTPVNGIAGFDAGPLDAAVAAVAAVARPGDLLLIRSTVPVGTTRSISERLQAAGLDLDVASAPDRSIEGRSYREQFEVPHLIGGITVSAATRAAALLGRLGQVRDVGNAEQAEAAKLLCNVLRYVTFGVANEIAALCEQRGLDMHAIAAVARDAYPRFALARPGPVGGACLLKDTMLLLHGMDATTAPIICAARVANGGVSMRAATAIVAHLAGIPAPVIAILGVAFKGHPPIDNARGSVALDLADRLRDLLPSVRLRAWDAEIAIDRLAGLAFDPASDALEAADGANVCVLANDHPAIAALDMPRLAAALAPGGLLYDMAGVTAGREALLPAGTAFSRIGTGRTSERHRT
jgi:UDP-N-acetyl-D-mannosaminuronic acid dehydrogenase